MPASALQIEANQANAAHSTGPRTPEGKAASAQNATRHGLTAAVPLILPGEESAFDDLTSGLAQSVRPEGALEQVVFSRLVLASWNLRRCDLLEAAQDTSGQNEANSSAIHRHAAHSGRILFRCIAELRKLQTERGLRDAALRQQFPLPAPDMDAIPPLASFAEIAKRTQPATPEQALESAFRVVDRNFLDPEPAVAPAEIEIPRNEPNFDAPAAPRAVQSPAGPTPIATYRRDGPKPGRNESCPCGSGQKYKRCCGK